MGGYIARRLLLLPITLFFIVLVNFTIMSFAPGDPVTISDLSEQGASRRADRGTANPSENRYLQFREFYGLTLPVLFNPWTFISKEKVYKTLVKLAHPGEMSVKDFDDLRIRFGDQARFVMPSLLEAVEDPALPLAVRDLAQRFFIRGAFRLGYAGPGLSEKQRKFNQKIARDNEYLSSLAFDPQALRKWFEENKGFYGIDAESQKRLSIFFLDTRFAKYLSRVATLNFGVMRNDPNKTVLSEVVKRFKYSLTLSVIPLILTFFLSLFFGMVMAVWKGQFLDWGPNLLFLVLFAIPVFVAAPFLIEKVAMGHTFPFTDTPIPTSGFTSSDRVYDKLTTGGRLVDILKHIAIPLLAILYGSLAVQSRISRTAFLETMKKDYVRTAYVKGVPRLRVLFKHIGRNASITLVTSIAGSLGVVLGGSLIVETLFEIDGFGKFFYDAILNRDYNVIMFSALAGSFLTLLGYLIGDLAYMFLDPRVRLE